MAYPTPINPWQVKAPQTNAISPNTVSLDESVASNDLEEEKSSSLSERLGENPSVLELLDFLIFISSSEENDDIHYFSETIDAIRDHLKQEPESVQILLDQFLAVDADSDAIYYITSLLQSAELSDRELILDTLAENLALDGSVQSNRKLLHLISNTPLVGKNKRSTEHVINIAVFEKQDATSKLQALDLLQPFQLNKSQRQNIVQDLESFLVAPDNTEQAYVLENIIRFSEPDQRQILANTYLNDSFGLATRISVINSLTEGTLDPSPAIKDQLLDIAQNESDPLYSHARHALMFAFDISNDEYNKIR